MFARADSGVESGASVIYDLFNASDNASDGPEIPSFWRKAPALDR